MVIAQNQVPEKDKTMKNTRRKILRANAILVLAACLGALHMLGAGTQIATAQNAPQTSGLLEGSIVVYVWEAAPAIVDDAGRQVDPRMSRELASSGLEALSILRTWQGHLTYSIRNGYPLSEAWVNMDRERADAALQQAALRATTDADRMALRMLVTQFENLKQWSDGLLEENRNMRLAQYYMSPAGLDNDELFQKTAACGNFLGPMLASAVLSDHPACN
jgi:hypothetical protein